MQVLERPPASILIYCTNNGLRSPMAEGMVKCLQGDNFRVSSVGVRAGTLDQFAVTVMREIGIDISSHCPRTAEALTCSSFDLVLSLSPEAQDQAVCHSQITGSEHVFWNTSDPSLVEGNRGVRMAAYRGVRDILFNHFKRYFVDVGLAVLGPEE